MRRLALRVVFLFPQCPSEPKHAEYPINHSVHQPAHISIADAFDEMKRILRIAAFSLIVLAGSDALRANGASLTYNNATNISLTSPSTTLTIASGSVADNLVVNATSVAVTLSTTGESFVVTSPSYDLSVATSTGGGSAIVSCSGGIETAALFQGTGSTVYTITPGSTNCATASAPNITGIAATNVTTNSATITWATNIAADSTVSYGTTASYGATSTVSTLVTAHSVSLSNLNAGTLYHYAVISSEYGTSTASGDNTFTTASATTGGGSVVSTGGGGLSYSVSIDNGAATTATTSVTLSLWGTGAYTMEVSNTSTFAGAAWIPYATTLPWTLAPNLGNETVYAEFKSVGGSVVGNAQASIDLVAGGSASPSSSSSSSASSTADLLALINSLTTQLNALRARVGDIGITSAASGTASFIFTRDLQLHDTGVDVRMLQQFLNNNGFLVSQTGPGSPGNETTYFGVKTLVALVSFQKSAGIVPAKGYFGPITRALLGKLIGQ
jgi:Putative peptidoglycan binding domain